MAPDPSVYVATESFATEFDGEPEMILQGQTRVAAGHPLLDAFPDRFKPADTDVHFPVEAATAAPGEQRRAPSAKKPAAKKPAAKKPAAKKPAAKAAKSSEPAAAPDPAPAPSDAPPAEAEEKAGEKS